MEPKLLLFTSVLIVLAIVLIPSESDAITLFGRHRYRLSKPWIVIKPKIYIGASVGKPNTRKSVKIEKKKAEIETKAHIRKFLAKTVIKKFLGNKRGHGFKLPGLSIDIDHDHQHDHDHHDHHDD